MSIKYFSFAPGIPYTVRGGIVSPQIDGRIWKRVLEGKEATILVNGGLMECFVSLSYCEALNILSPSTKIKWAGPSGYESLATMNGLSTVVPYPYVGIENEFPLPIFLDRNYNVYFNCLNNYARFMALSTLAERKDRTCLVRRIIKNLGQPWVGEYQPKIRSFGKAEEELAVWGKAHNVSFKQPFICLFPDPKYSLNKKDYLEMTEMDARALIVMLKQAGINTLVFTDAPRGTYPSSWHTLPVRFEHIFYLLQFSKATLSKTLDYFIVSALLGSGVCVSRRRIFVNAVKRNIRALEVEPDIYTRNQLVPKEVFERIYAKVHQPEIYDSIHRNGNIQSIRFNKTDT